MARDGSGSFNQEGGYPYQSNTTIDASDMNTTLLALGDALTQSLSKDGQTTPSANLPMGTNRHTGVGNGTARDQYASVGQLQDRATNLLTSVAGTANAITATLTPAITSYVEGLMVSFVAGSASTTTTPTIAINGLAAKTIKTPQGNALLAGQIVSGKTHVLYYDGTDFLLLLPETLTGTFTGTVTGVSGSVTVSATYRITNSVCTISWNGGGTGTSTTTGCGMTGIPAIAQPSVTRFMAGVMYDNGQTIAGYVAIGGGTMTLQKMVLSGGAYVFDNTAFTASGQKGFITNSYTYAL